MTTAQDGGKVFRTEIEIEHKENCEFRDFKKTWFSLDIFIHSFSILTIGPKPSPKRFFHIV
jgi:hypothetical protein